MIRFILRFLAVWLTAAGLVMVVIDGTKSIAESRLVFTPLAETWADWAAASLESVRQAIADSPSAWAWGDLARFLLSAPTFAILLVLAGLLFWLGRPRRRFQFAHERDL
ncbi:hypothetical protein [Afifella sp. IM 167]|uniref:hypothetical protein n=1 Tax=Afifella sp. IM 167 TaxID=2033586 RepID=UPI001CCFC154|nr:hypothetical protein [Afifella sp. IM 167]MBZ8133668.1 hypothetical protein [Afifella sp. IM 167]